jgi:hypothetical protein
MKMSKASLEEEDKRGARRGAGGDPISEIYALLRDLAERRGVSDIPYADAVGLIAQKAYGTELLDACLEEYASLNVWQLDDEKNISFGE